MEPTTWLLYAPTHRARFTFLCAVCGHLCGENRADVRTKTGRVCTYCAGKVGRDA